MRPHAPVRPLSDIGAGNMPRILRHATRPMPASFPSPATVALPAAARPSRFLRRHLWWPLAGALAASTVLMGFGLDQHLADLLYSAEGGQWLLKDHWLTTSVIHHDGKLLSTIAALAVLAAGLFAPRGTRLRAWRRPLLVLAASIALATVLVSVLKSLTGMDCPWDLARYGGHRPFVGLFESRHGLAASGCFPAGHASAGYAWVALYFFALAVRPRWRWAGLAVGLGAGLVFGISQQLRGAHFLSHDLWTLMACWCSALALHLAFGRAAGEELA